MEDYERPLQEKPWESARNDQRSQAGASQASDDFDSASYDASSRGTHQQQQQKQPKAGTTRIPWAKALVLAVLIGSAGAVTTAVYIFTDNQQEADFVQAFDTVAETVLESKDVNARNIRRAFEQFALTIGSYSVDWPLTTIPYWEKQCQHLRSQTGSTDVSFVPLVDEPNRKAWEEYSVSEQGWLQESLDFQESEKVAQDITPFIWRLEENSNTPVKEVGPADPYYAPIWQRSPPSADADGINRNGFDLGDYFAPAFDKTLTDEIQVVSEVVNWDQDLEDPFSVMFSPVFDSEQNIVGLVLANELWKDYFVDLLPPDLEGVLVVVEVGCYQVLSFEINGPDAVYLGHSDKHGEEYDKAGVSELFDEIVSVGDCPVVVTVYPTDKFAKNYSSSRSILYSFAALLIFAGAGSIFLLYDWTVQKVHGSLEEEAAKTGAIVNSLFPANVRDRLIMDQEQNASGNRSGRGGSDAIHGNSTSRNGINDLREDEAGIFKTRPIADLFPSATVMFADIVGFTAWSSTREPSQVFTLLETVYNAFDKIANRRRVFKVETIGDCYVAVAGLPDPRPDHAIIMARFAHDCLLKIKYVVQRLEVALGPDTDDLGMRFGLHSGPVTAGVLRGEKSRFQLFGDTVNTAARIENLGQVNKIHISAETAELIEEHGKPEWLNKRDTTVQAKGKGEIQTFWLDLKGANANNNNNTKNETTSVVSAPTRASFASRLHGRPMDQIAKKVTDKKLQRLIGWNVDVLKRQLRLILAMRDPERISPAIATVFDQEWEGDEEGKFSRETANETSSSSEDDNSDAVPHDSSHSVPNFEILQIEKEEGKTVLDEVKEIITLPTAVAKNKTDPFNIEFSPEVVTQLTDYVTSIAEMYHDNSFHSFEHASHVTMSVCKLMARIVTPDSIDYEKMEVTRHGEEELHSYTYGITSDPITQFACTLAALIHDVDHSGVPNAQLVKENNEIAIHYKNKSVAEQNSVDLAWELLMEPQYSELRSCIYTTKEELNRFRQLLVNSVMATDIADKELGALRKNRWAKAFNSSPGDNPDETSIREDSNRKATIVIEHLIQASDVSHTMQHWHIYLKWNERLFREMYKGYRDGRAPSDPSKGWYKGELGFFDFYLIPLAKKLQECRVFGSASDEYLNYAQANRKEWEVKGQEIVQKYLENYERELGDQAKQGER